MSTTAGCFGKIGYPTRAEADLAKSRLHEKRGYVKAGTGRSRAGAKLQAYHCCKCGRFQLGRDRRAGQPPRAKVKDHEAGSYKLRKARYQELTE